MSLLELQTWYDTPPRAVVAKLFKAMYDRLSWGAAHASLQQYLDFLAQTHPNALLLQHLPPEEETVFRQAQDGDCRQRLAGLTPVTEQQLKTRPLHRLLFLHHVFTILEAAVAGEVIVSQLEICKSFVR